MQYRTDEPLVSVFIASYNHAPYIEASILSVLEQTYQNIELLVVDDGSTDDSVERILKLQKQHNFDFHSQPNQGLAKTLNDCIARSHGSLIAPFGSDDIMLPERITIQVAYMQDKPEVGICGGNTQIIGANGESLEKRNKKYVHRRLNFDDVFLNTKPGVPAPTLFFRREALEAVGGFDTEIRLEDLLIALKITHAGYVIDVLEDVLAKYRVHDSNTYKNYQFMIDNVLKTYAKYQDHPAYSKVRLRFINSMALKCARNDKALTRQLLKQLPLRSWNSKTLRAIFRLFFS